MLNSIFLAATGASIGGLIFPFILMIGFFYLIVYIPENKRKKKYKGMLEMLKVNDEIITKGGILGKIINIQETFVILETGPSRTRIKMDKNGILSVLNSDQTVKKEDKQIKENKTKEIKAENKDKKEETKEEETEKETKEN